jgi:hypothetical protein
MYRELLKTIIEIGYISQSWALLLNMVQVLLPEFHNTSEVREVKVKLSLCLTKHCTMEMYGEEGV